MHRQPCAGTANQTVTLMPYCHIILLIPVVFESQLSHVVQLVAHCSLVALKYLSHLYIPADLVPSPTTVATVHSTQAYWRSRSRITEGEVCSMLMYVCEFMYTQMFVCTVKS